MLVFVYGSLLSGLHNHRYLAGATLIGPGHTATAEWDMVSLGSYPGVTAGGTARVAGELYDVDDQTLAALDRLEGHPTFYCRTECRVRVGRRVYTAWMYVYQGHHGTPIESRRGIVNWRQAVRSVVR